MEIYSNIYATENRDFLLVELLKYIQGQTGRKELTLEEIAKKVKEVRSLWFPIPTKHLEFSVVTALQVHNKDFPFAPLEVVSAWNEIKESLAQKNVFENAERQTALECPFCKGVGMMPVERVIEGRSVKGVTHCKNKCKPVTNLSRERDDPSPEAKEIIKLCGQRAIQEKAARVRGSGWISVSGALGNLALDEKLKF